ncbi:MAG: sigma-54-dependent transcriptional regulator [Myxococcota bacterium]
MHVLIADDDPTISYMLKLFCRGQDFEVVFAETGSEALRRFSSEKIDVVVTDVRMPGASGETVLDEVLKLSSETPVILMTAHGSVDDAVRFIQRGAMDYIEKPLTREVFLHRVNSALQRVAMSRELEALKASLQEGGDRPRMIGSTPVMEALMRRLPMTAQTDASVVIYGESGTGKELVAERIHELSRRREKPFITVNCGALSDTLLESELFGYRRGAFTDAHRDTQGLVEAAEGGTLFLDEIGEVSAAVQVKLLRFLQLKEFKPLGSPKVHHADVRIIAATHRDRKRMVQEGGFREDLYYRLNVVPLVVPPLRERKRDVPLLAMHFLQKFRHEYRKDIRGFSTTALAAISSYHWPGNVRELENKVQQLVVLSTGSLIDIHDLGDDPLDASEGLPVDTTATYKEEKRRVLDAFEREYVRRLLEQTEDNLSEAARLAGLDRKNFWTLARRHGYRSPRRGRRPTVRSREA